MKGEKEEVMKDLLLSMLGLMAWYSVPIIYLGAELRNEVAMANNLMLGASATLVGAIIVGAMIVFHKGRSS